MTRKIFQVGFGVLLRATFDIAAQFQVDSIKFDSSISRQFLILVLFFSPPIPNVRRNEKKKRQGTERHPDEALFFLSSLGISCFLSQRLFDIVRLCMLQQIVYEVTQIACAYKLSLCVFFTSLWPNLWSLPM